MFDITTLTGYAQLSIVIGGGLILLLSLKGKLLKEKIDAADRADDRLITILQTTVQNLETKVTELTKVQQETTLELEKMKSENSILREVLQGRDASSTEMQKQGMEAIKRTEMILVLTQETHSAVMSTNKNVEKLITVIEKHLRVMEKK